MVEYSKERVNQYLQLFEPYKAKLISYSVEDFKAHHHTFNKIEIVISYMENNKECKDKLTVYDTLYKNHRVFLQGIVLNNLRN